MQKIPVIIPALRPDERTIETVRQLLQEGMSDIILIDDGSGEAYAPVFTALQQKYSCTVLRHAVNLGKGRALKTGFNFALNAYPDMLGVVTVDADGQHAVADIAACCNRLRQTPNALVLGSRDFSAKNVPFKSRWGNVITRNVFAFLCGVRVSDTQTGLRAIPTDYLKVLMNVPGERFEYEMNMLVELPHNNVPVEQVPIQTIYLDGNSSSHFNPLRDALRIYAIFGKFLISSLSSSVVDIAAFTVFVWAFTQTALADTAGIWIATFAARAVSSMFNFLVNKNTVFKSGATNKSALIRYYILCAAQACISALLVAGVFAAFGASKTLIKIFVDVLLFLASYQIQKRWVFKR
ncbi:MAG: bifunctional glycosyltransferase family 2/GtrA family protein [Oscillospiraceae bacterium]|nr:bifunctional glycosyltransferase family 2/GtrA family protein [Oscillospiraceae bacterium]